MGLQALGFYKACPQPVSRPVFLQVQESQWEDCQLTCLSKTLALPWDPFSKLFRVYVRFLDRTRMMRSH